MQDLLLLSSNIIEPCAHAGVSGALLRDLRAPRDVLDCHPAHGAEEEDSTAATYQVVSSVLSSLKHVSNLSKCHGEAAITHLYISNLD